MSNLFAILKENFFIKIFYMINKAKLLSNFPVGPIGMKEWPWTNEIIDMPDLMPDKRKWPKISIVTPSYNQGNFLEETIRSILLQNYPNLEYIIIDGGSNDNSVDIIKKYQSWISYWVSESDNGQAHAINKGLERCTGEIFNWINSDDLLTQGSLKIIAESMIDFDAVAGSVLNFCDVRECYIRPAQLLTKKMISGDPTVIYQQPGTWLRTDRLKKVGGFDESLHFCFDWYATINYLHSFPKIRYLDEVLAKFRLHNASKTVNQGLEFRREKLIISQIILYREDLRDIYSLEPIKCLQRYLWIEEIDRLKNNQCTRPEKFKSIFSAIFSNLLFYPYRYALGALKDLILNKRTLN